MKTRTGLFLLFTLLLLAVGGRTFAAPLVSLSVENLGPGRAIAINDAGQVVGTSEGSAVLWDLTGTPQVLFEGAAADINNSGHVVGAGVLWTKEDGAHAIPLDFEFMRTYWLTGISDSGLVVGTWSKSWGETAFVWTESAGGQSIAGNESWGYGSNSQEQVVGEAVSEGYPHAFIWSQPGGLCLLPSLGGHFSAALAINTAGQVVGYSHDSTENEHAFLWSEANGIQDLGTLGEAMSTARGINDRGQVVGDSTTLSGDNHAFFWSPGQGMLDLGTLGGSTSVAFGINNYGRIVGSSTDASEEEHAMVWQLQVSTQTTLSATPSTAVAGQPIAFSVTVAPGVADAGTPLGSVQIKIDGTNWGSPLPLANGVASTPPISTLSPGSHTISASFTASHVYWDNSQGTLAYTVQAPSDPFDLLLPFIAK